MRVHKISISGYKPIPFCADHDTDCQTLNWQEDAFCLTLPTTEANDTPMLSALMGANSSGKSSVLFALRDFFDNPTKLNPQLFNSDQTDNTIIVEITFRGTLTEVEEWHQTNCVQLENGIYELTIARGWSTEKRKFDHIRKADGTLHKFSSTKDKKFVEFLLPKFRVIMADHKPSDETSAKKDSLIYDLIEDMIKRDKASQSIIGQLNGLIEQFEELVDRNNQDNEDAWHAVRQLEESLSTGLAAITPQQGQVKLIPHRPMTNVNDIFLKSALRIDDGVELDFSQHGLGLQRSFIVSMLNTWCEKIAHDNESDYLFAIEEPEIYLHPHATRVLLNQLEKIAQTDQVLFTTHASEFINRVPLNHVFIVRRQNQDKKVCSNIQQPDLTDLSKDELAKAQRYLREDRSDMLFARSVILVEGQAELFALPMFAQKLGIDLDQAGVSVVHVNGINNMRVYHHILKAFGIPHVMLIDGDGQPEERNQQYTTYANKLFVFNVDFEYQLAHALAEERVLEIVNTCRQRKGIDPFASFEITPVTATNIKSRWWQRLHDKIKQDIPNKHRSEHEPIMQQLKDTLTQLAQAALDNNHLDTDSTTKQKAERLAREGKPLSGRVIGEMLTREEVESLPIIKSMLEEAITLAKP